MNSINRNGFTANQGNPGDVICFLFAYIAGLEIRAFFNLSLDVDSTRAGFDAQSHKVQDKSFDFEVQNLEIEVKALNSKFKTPAQRLKASAPPQKQRKSRL
ncbi:MAG: hypothetical protein LBD29_11430 [Treponema sp.]|jgi:hypothetical protein|nr:hypothetical protein [Treponema sp.]